ncbi:MAG TPA: Crp/Fnr family transcriptional regulator [Burkholderiaceae bacterium]|jgi:CRP-like cAMP-binding protein|nr:Crp/Fnr family transcriptional regulator [Burkholderiaceae bacterium]
MQTGKIRIQDFLFRLPLFSDMSPADLDRIAESTTEQHIARNEILFQRGDPCLGFHIVVYGQIKLAFTSLQGGEKVMKIAGPGHSFGEALMFVEKPYILYAQALTDSMVLHVGQAAIFEELARDPKLARKMLAGLSRRLQELVSDVEAYSLHSGTQRVIGYLLKNEDYADGDQIELQVSKTIIASRLSLTPEHFSRILHDLSDRGLISVNGRTVTILNVDGLRKHEG